MGLLDDLGTSFFFDLLFLYDLKSVLFFPDFDLLFGDLSESFKSFFVNFDPSPFFIDLILLFKDLKSPFSFDFTLLRDLETLRFSFIDSDLLFKDLRKFFLSFSDNIDVIPSFFEDFDFKLSSSSIFSDVCLTDSIFLFDVAFLFLNDL